MRSVTVPAFDVIRNPPQAVPLMTKCEGLRSNRKDLINDKEDNMDNNLLVPEQEPDRQYYYMDEMEIHDFIEHHLNDLAASLEKTIVDILMKKLRMAAKDLNIKQVAVAGGVSANNGLRNAFHDYAKRYGWKVFIPKFSYTTDNAAMIAITAYYKYLNKEFCPVSAPAYSRNLI